MSKLVEERLKFQTKNMIPILFGRRTAETELYGIEIDSLGILELPTSFKGDGAARDALVNELRNSNLEVIATPDDKKDRHLDLGDVDIKTGRFLSSAKLRFAGEEMIVRGQYFRVIDKVINTQPVRKKLDEYWKRPGVERKYGKTDEAETKRRISEITSGDNNFISKLLARWYET